MRKYKKRKATRNVIGFVKLFAEMKTKTTATLMWNDVLHYKLCNQTLKSVPGNQEQTYC